MVTWTQDQGTGPDFPDCHLGEVAYQVSAKLRPLAVALSVLDGLWATGVGTSSPGAPTGPITICKKKQGIFKINDNYTSRRVFYGAHQVLGKPRPLAVTASGLGGLWPGGVGTGSPEAPTHPIFIC